MADKIRWGILSTAQIAKNSYVPAINESDNGEIVAVASRSLEKAQAFADECGIPKAYGSYEELLADPDVDAVYNPLPVSMHCEWSIKCAQAGKPCLCEKPMARNAAEVEQMVTAFKEKDLLLAEALMYRFHSLTRKALDIIHSGGIGDVKIARSSFNVDICDPNDIRLRKDMGGGALLDLGVYCVSILRQIMQAEPETIKSVARWGKESGVDETMAGVMQFPSGAIGYFGCGLKAQFDCSYEVCGTTGRLLVDFGAMCAWPGTEFTIKYSHDGEDEEIVTPACNHYTAMVNDFNEALLTGRPMTYGMEDTLNNMRSIDRIFADAE